MPRFGRGFFRASCGLHLFGRSVVRSASLRGFKGHYISRYGADNTHTAPNKAILSRFKPFIFIYGTIYHKAIKSPLKALKKPSKRHHKTKHPPSENTPTGCAEPPSR